MWDHKLLCQINSPFLKGCSHWNLFSKLGLSPSKKTQVDHPQTGILQFRKTKQVAAKYLSLIIHTDIKVCFFKKKKLKPLNPLFKWRWTFSQNRDRPEMRALIFWCSICLRNIPLQAPQHGLPSDLGPVLKGETTESFQSSLLRISNVWGMSFSQNFAGCKETQPSIHKCYKDVEMPLNKFQPVLSGTELETGSHQGEGHFSVSLELHNPSPAFLCVYFIL